jgi:hypothetical protein
VLLSSRFSNGQIVVQNLVFTEDFNSNGRICLSGQCLSNQEIQYIIAQQAPRNISLKSVISPSLYFSTFSASANDYRLQQLSGAPVTTEFTLQMREAKSRSFLGCYQANTTNSATPLLENNRGNLAYSKCYQAAVRNGDDYFALQNFGACSTGRVTSYGAFGVQPTVNCMFSCTFNAVTSIPTTVPECGNTTAVAIYNIDLFSSQISPNLIKNSALVSLF